MFVFKSVRLYVLTFMLTLSACGGGGGDGNSSGGATLTLSTNNLTFTAVNIDSTPASQTVTATVSGNINGALYIRIVSSGSAVDSISNVVITGTNTGQASINPASAASLGPGTYSSTITVTACTSGPMCTSDLIGTPQTINVTYTINGVSATSSALNYSIDNAPIVGDLTQQFTITGYPTQDWTVSDDVDWLSLSPTNGNTSGSVHITPSLVESQIDMLNNGVYAGLITITPTLGSAVTIPVTLTIARTQVNYVAPYTATSSTLADVVIRGESFNQVAITGVNFGSFNAMTFSVVSDTEIHARHPELPVGSHSVQLQNNLGINKSLANLVVVDAPNYLAGTLAYPNSTSKRVINLAYDAERKALLVGIVYPSSGTSANEFLRYVHNGIWSSAATKPFSDLETFALSTDGKQLLLAAGLTITQVDPSKLTNGTVTTNQSGQGAQYIKGLGITNDGDAIALTAAYGSGFSPAYRYPIRTPELTLLTNDDFYWGNLGASADGSLVLMGSTFSSGLIYKYDSSTRTVDTTGQSLDTISLGLNRTGSRVLLNNTNVYNNNFTLLGSLPNTTLDAVLSPAGTRAYTYDSNGMLRTFDLTASPVGGLYPEIGAGTTLAGDPGSGINGTSMKMLITPDGGTLFLAGSTQIVIQPVP